MIVWSASGSDSGSKLSPSTKTHVTCLSRIPEKSLKQDMLLMGRDKVRSWLRTAAACLTAMHIDSGPTNPIPREQGTVGKLERSEWHFVHGEEEGISKTELLMLVMPAGPARLAGEEGQLSSASMRKKSSGHSKEPGREVF